MKSSLANKLVLSVIIVCLMSFLCVSSLFAANILLSWDPPTTNDDGTELNDLAGYKVYFGLEAGNYSDSIDVGNVMTYEANDLSAGATYYFAITAYDIADNESQYSNEISKTFPVSDTTPPVISGVQASGITNSSVTVSWATDEVSDTKVQYGTTISYGTTTPLDPSMVTSHNQSIGALTASTLYHYRVISNDAAGNEAISIDYTFTTSALPELVYYYCDGDNDGYAGTSIDGFCIGIGCVPAGCQTMPGSDCNNNNNEISPDAADNTCNGIDNNCDGIPDNNYVTQVVSCGSGVCSSVGQLECLEGVEVNSCIPGMPTENPETTCGDDLDNDCDGQIDEDCFPDIVANSVLIGTGFSAGFPTEWSQNGAWNANNECGRVIGSPFEGSYAIVDSSCTVTAEDELLTGIFDAASCDSVTLAFSNQYHWYSGNIEVNVSNDGGATWEDSFSSVADDGHPLPNWKDIDISSVSGSPEAQIKFRYVNNAADGFWALDNVWVTCQSKQIPFSARVQETAIKTIMVSNEGIVELVIGTVDFEGADASEFSVGENDDCTSQTLLPSDSCAVDIVFAPLSSGEKSANISISSNDPDTPVLSVSLVGTGTDTVMLHPVIKVNGLSDIVNVTINDNIKVVIELDAVGNTDNADWWVLADTPSGWYSYNMGNGTWVFGQSVTYQGPLADLVSYEVWNFTLSPGPYTIYFGVDMNMNGSIDMDQIYYDYVNMIIAP